MQTIALRKGTAELGAVLSAVLWTGCASDPPEAVGAAAQPVGEVIDGYPSYEERVGLVFINRVRADPNNVAKGTAADCSTRKDPVPPVMYHWDLAQAARFHCVHCMKNQGGLSHPSYCELRDDLESSGCDGVAACSCKPGTECWSCETNGGCGSSAADRARLFGYGGGDVPEVGAAGTFASGAGAAQMWATECPAEGEGHRNTLTSAHVNVVGTGAATGTGCWSSYFFADFGSVSDTPIARIASGVHAPGSQGGLSFYANYYDPAGDPQSIHVVVDGVCHPMSPELGDAGNRTFLAEVSGLSGGCHEYYFAARDAAGQAATLPSSGSYTAGSCAEEFVAGQRTSPCSAGTPADSGIDGVADAHGGDAGRLGDSGSAMGNEEEDSEGCACSAPGARTLPAGWAFAGLFGVVSAVVRRTHRRPLRVSG